MTQKEFMKSQMVAQPSTDGPLLYIYNHNWHMNIRSFMICVIQAPGRGHGIVDAMNGHDKTYLDTVLKQACINPMDTVKKNDHLALLCHNVQDGKRIGLSS